MLFAGRPVMPSFPRILRLVAVTLCLLASAGAQSAAEFDSVAEAQIFAELNQARVQEGAPALRLDPKLTEAARKHSALMAQKEKLSHQFAGEPVLSDRLRTAGVYFTQSAENAGVNSDLANITAMFLASPGHRANMLNPVYNSVGIGIMRSGRSYWITEDFAQEIPNLSSDEAASRAATALEATWKSIHAEPLKRVDIAGLHVRACETAGRGKLQPDPVAYGTQTARQLFAYSTSDPSSLARQVDALLDMPHLQIYAVAACSPAESGDNGHYWILLALF